ncbi:MAG TPA: FAD-binding oxidoreductase, partial [Gemmatimonadaceae bacterium]|nr:FAD-binding oxidoreductase [Gemmatimonadaceae bacterium]
MASDVFTTTFGGEILRPSAPDYDVARKVWNGMIDRRPAYIARCKSVADVQSAIRFALDENLAISVRGGGHNAAGLAVCDDGVVIDLSGMRDVVIDPVGRTARVSGGATWGEFDRAAGQHGLATTGGAVSTTGVAGLTLGGGLGWLMRSYGMTCDNLIGAEVVTADGRVVHASATENPDLLWALQGGGGNFGIVTTFEFQLHPVTTILGGMLLYPLSKARDLLRAYRDVARTAPDALTVFAAMLHAPDGTPVVGFVICYNGPADEGERAIKAMRDFDKPIAGEVGPMPYTALQGMLDDGFPSGLQVHWRSEFLASIPDDLIEAAVSAFERVPSPLSALMFEQFGGAVQRVAADAT